MAEAEHKSWKSFVEICIFINILGRSMKIQ